MLTYCMVTMVKFAVDYKPENLGQLCYTCKGLSWSHFYVDFTQMPLFLSVLN